MPEAVQQPVLVVRANDPHHQQQCRQPPAIKSEGGPLSLCMLQANATTRRRCGQVVERVRLDSTRLNDAPPHLSPPSPSLSASSSASWDQCHSKCSSSAPSKLHGDVGTTLTIDMSDIFAYAPNEPRVLDAAATLCEHGIQSAM
ncbi:hypothetical protein IWW38_005975 [Coemansia aciculifera]|uniref:Uncharacterized protein n=1 Tax=Coemansia aciculifera TaxID=417176 RepID=A0ACC1LV38_9FUNG|nr:hypothetical protein IWW38_005975 [Coemansia aciculifera]